MSYSDVKLQYRDTTMLYSHINMPDIICRDIIMPHPFIVRPYRVLFRLPADHTIPPDYDYIGIKITLIDYAIRND